MSLNKDDEERLKDQIGTKNSQIKILLNSIREAVNDNKCPKRIKDSLLKAVKSAKSLASNMMRATDSYDKSLQIEAGCLCKNALNLKDLCVYKVLRKGLVIDNVQLWEVQVAEGDSNTPVGVIQHNVPESFLSRI